ncbi:MAG TPA: hypothetical protein VGC88_08050 [Terriglobales bacterium]
MTTGVGLAFRPHDDDREDISQAERELQIQIARLEQRLEILNTRFMAENQSDRRNSIQREVFAVQTAVDHYRIMQTQHSRRSTH